MRAPTPEIIQIKVESLFFAGGVTLTPLAVSFDGHLVFTPILHGSCVAGVDGAAGITFGITTTGAGGVTMTAGFVTTE